MQPQITLRDQKVSFADLGGSAIARTEADGCCCCSVAQSLCYSISIADASGATYTADEADIMWDSLGGLVSLGPFGEYAIFIYCGLCGISVFVAWGGFFEECLCTYGSAELSFPCVGVDSYAGSVTADIPFADQGVACEAPCPDHPGTITMEIRDPPC